MPTIAPIHPGEILMEELLAPLQVSQNRLAVAIGVPPRRINEIVRGKRRITADTAIRLARYFGTTDRFWLNLQSSSAARGCSLTPRRPRLIRHAPGMCSSLHRTTMLECAPVVAADHTGSMWTDKVELLTTVTAADWIRPRLAGGLGHVADTIPTGFDAYARILHPVEGAREEPVRWADVAGVTGRTVHPEVQWHTLIGAPDPWNPASELWDQGEPAQGNLALPQLLALCETLTRHTTTPDDCYFALWEGWAQLHAGARARLTLEGKRRYRLPRFLRRPVRGTPIPPVITATELQAPRVHLRARAYLLFRGPLSAMDAFAHYDGAATPFPQTQAPSLFWPADRAWCVATEIDFTSTLVAAAVAAVYDVVTHPLLEALPLTGTESLRHDADTINQ